MKISNSKLNRYSTCPKSYQLHYIKNIKTTTISCSLIFGSSLDTAFNEILLGTGDGIKTLAEEFIKFKFDINLVYAKSDFDKDLIYPEFIKWLQDYFVSEHQLVVEDVFVSYNIIKDKAQLIRNDQEKLLFNLMNWESMYQKGLIMLRDYKKRIIPKFKRVIDVQVEVNTELDGVPITGFIDFIAELQDGTIVLFDNKTSSWEYPEDSVKKSTQLSLYKQAMQVQRPDLNISKYGYIVMRKGLKKNRVKKCVDCSYIGQGSHKSCDNNTLEGKRCGGKWVETVTPETDIQFIVDNIEPEWDTIIRESVSDVAKAVKSEVFPRNLSKCDDIYGKPCEFRGLCLYGSMRGLYKEED